MFCEFVEGGYLVIFFIINNKICIFIQKILLSTSSEIKGCVANWPDGIIVLVNNSLLTVSVDKAL